MPKFHIRYRVKKLSLIIGNKELVETIDAFVGDEDRPQTYVLHGPRGCGKTTIGKIMAKEFGASGRDFKLLDIGNTGGVEDARKIDQEAHYSPHGKSKVYLLDECQRGSAQFFDALLKVTEEPPKNVYFIFATTQKEKMPKPLLSRCALKNLPVRLLTANEMEELVTKVLDKEEKEFERKTINMIIEAADGSPREALTCLNEVITLSDKKAQRKLRSYTYEEDANVAALCRAMTINDWNACKNLLRKIERSNLDSEHVRRTILKYCKKALLGSGGEVFAIIIDHFLENTWNAGFPAIVLWTYEVCMGEV